MNQPPVHHLNHNGHRCDCETIVRCLSGVRKHNQQDITELWCVSHREMMERCDRLFANAKYRDIEGTDDVTNEAFGRLVRKLQAGKYLEVNNSESYWRMLTCFVQRQAGKFIRRHRRSKHFFVRESDLFRFGECHKSLSDFAALSEAPNDSSDLMTFLNSQDAESQTIAKLRIASLPINEIAAKLHVTRSTIQRKLHSMLLRWKTFRRSRTEGR